jgi:hypothetical protein
MKFNYRPAVLEALTAHGVMPGADSPPELIRDFINDLYRFEIRRLRTQMLGGEFPKAEYASRVDELRSRYPILGIPILFWTDQDEPANSART